MPEPTCELSIALCGRGGLRQVEQDPVAVLQQGRIWTSPGELGYLHRTVVWYGVVRCGTVWYGGEKCGLLSAKCVEGRLSVEC